MELPSELLENIAFNTRPKSEEHILIFIDKSVHREHLSEPLQTIFERFKISVPFQTGFNRIFIARNKKIRFYSAKSNTDNDGFIQKLYQQVPTNSKVRKMELKDLFLKNIISQKYIMRSK